jgi:hypothetical protein
MGSAVLAYLRRHHLALIALFVALGSTSYAAITIPRNSVGSAQIKRNAVNSAKVRDRSLLATDFRRGQLRAGAKGDKGDTGPRGETGTVDTSNFFNKGESDGRYIRNQSASAQSGSLFIDGTLRSSGALRLGSETGTGEPPNYPSGSSGLVIRRIHADNPTDEIVVARVGVATFERRGFAVNFAIDNGAGTFPVDADCFGTTGAGVSMAKSIDAAIGVETEIFAQGDNIAAFTCTFISGINPAERNQTQVTLQRLTSSNTFIGTMISTDNQ